MTTRTWSQELDDFVRDLDETMRQERIEKNRRKEKLKEKHKKKEMPLDIKHGK